jgi:hypothetical protein
MSETWEDRYTRAVANFAGVPAEIPLADISIDVIGEDGYSYSSWTFADPSIRIWVRWRVDGKASYADIEGPEAVAKLIQSFLSPGEVS